MSCLMEALQDKRIRLQPECKKRLQDRIDMWSYAAKVNIFTESQLWEPCENWQVVYLFIKSNLFVVLNVIIVKIKFYNLHKKVTLS